MFHIERTIRLTLLCALGVVSSHCTAGARDEPPKESPQLLTGFDRFGRSVTTSSPEAQQWFDQGLQLMYGCDYAAAIAAFAQAIKHDPQCAMAWWGLANAHGPSIDDPRMSEAQSKAAYEAAQQALKHVEHVEPAERALVRALATRYALPAPANRGSLDKAFAAAMRQAWLEFPDDAEIGTAYAHALMTLQPHQYWNSLREPIGNAHQIIAILESTLSVSPSNPGANHYFVLAVEGSDDPMRAWRSATLLQELVPGSGHLMHVASHIFLRMGHYPRSADGNSGALEADRAMYGQTKPSDAYRLQMMRHAAALADAAMMEARFNTAMSACHRIQELADETFVKSHLKLVDGLMATKFQVLVRFGRWEEILNEPDVLPERIVSRAMRHSARGTARAAQGDSRRARLELDAMDEAINGIDEAWLMGMHGAKEILPIARKTLEGQIVYCEGKQEDAFATLRQAAGLEDQVVFKSPRGWMVPVRHALGAMLLNSGNAADAEATFRKDLEMHPHNAWAMIGLRDALLAQGRSAEADEINAKVSKAWSRSDVQPNSAWLLNGDSNHRTKSLNR